MALLLGIDVGTQATKVVAYDEDLRRVVATSSQPYPILPSQVPTRKEQHPHTWVQATFSATKSVLRSIDSKRVKALAVSGQQHGMVALDAARQVVRPAKLWCDLESATEASELSEAYGWTLVPGFTASKLLWMKRNEPDNFAATARVLLPHDYLNFVLTGVEVMECGDASGTGFINAERTWDLAAMKVVDPRVPDMFPDIVGPNQAIGTLLPTIATELGLEEGVVVGPGSGDNMMSALGAGAVTEGMAVLSLGTSGTIFGCSSRRVFDATGGVAPFSDATGQWLPLLCVMSCTGVLEEVREGYGMTHEEMTELAWKEPPGCEGITFLPYFAGERTPNWPHATGAILGMKAGNMRPGLVYRAALEGTAFTLLAGIQRLAAVGFEASELRVVGGGSKNGLWRRIMSDVFQLVLKFPEEPESAAVGAALQAGAVLHGRDIREYIVEQNLGLEEEIVTPDPEMRATYSEAFERFTNHGKLLFGS